jgi:hypothetical protein
VWGDPGQFGNPFSFVGGSPFNRLDPFGRDEGTPYPTEGAAVLEALREAMSYGKQTGYEYGGYIYTTQDGIGYSYVLVTSLSRKTVELPGLYPDGREKLLVQPRRESVASVGPNGLWGGPYVAVADFHTHPSGAAPGPSKYDLEEKERYKQLTTYIGEFETQALHPISGDTAPPTAGGGSESTVNEWDRWRLVVVKHNRTRTDTLVFTEMVGLQLPWPEPLVRGVKLSFRPMVGWLTAWEGACEW